MRAGGRPSVGAMARSPDRAITTPDRAITAPDPVALFLALRFPIAAICLPVAFRLDLSLDRVAAHLAGVLRGELLPVPLADHIERNIAVLVSSIGDLGVGVAAGDRAGQLVAVELQLEGHIAALAA